ncbi:hypothetical protein [Pseudobacillus badius]|uniref:hypothetical protein n=1 Tax=Bacillus badius TaxID=1455 RepID=UPI003D33AC9C
MGDLLFFLVLGIVFWIVYAKISKRPIIPWKETAATKEARSGFEKVMSDRKRKNAKKKAINSRKKNNKKGNDEDVYIEEEPDVFADLLDNIEDIKDHMIHLKDNEFIMFAEVRPCNYFLRSQDEQEAIDGNFESWLATLNYNIKIYLQARYVDLDEPIGEMRKNLETQLDLPPNAVIYGQTMLEDMERWQLSAPRYEVKRYILFTYKVNLNTLSGANSGNEREQRDKIEEKAFSELYRRLNAAKTILRKSYMEVDLLTTEGIIEVLYHAFNRRKALKTKYKNVKEREMLATYSTADQDQSQIEMVKEMLQQTG